MINTLLEFCRDKRKEKKIKLTTIGGFSFHTNLAFMKLFTGIEERSPNTQKGGNKKKKNGHLKEGLHAMPTGNPVHFGHI